LLVAFLFSAPVFAQKRYVVYFQSWSAKWVSDGANSELANMASYANVVCLAFMSPDCHYAGGLSLGGTGLQFSYDSGKTLKQAVDALKQRHPNTKVLVSIGGATFTNWGTISSSAKSIAQFVTDFGIDGVDIDYEPNNPNCAVGSDKMIHCASDNEYISIVKALRGALPNKLISAAAFSVGAYGEGNWTNGTPVSPNTGLCLGMLRSVGSSIDMLNVMSYDAGPTYNPRQALDAYKNYFKGDIVMGVETPPEAWGGHQYTIAEVKSLASYVVEKNARGMMLWSVQKGGNTSPNQMSQTICQTLGLSDCTQPLIPGGN